MVERLSLWIKPTNGRLSNLVFDLETNGLLRDLTKSTACYLYLDEATTHIYNDEGASKEPLIRGITRLEEADTIIGHNVIGFDVLASLPLSFLIELAVLLTLFCLVSCPDLLIDTKMGQHAVTALWAAQFEAYGHRLKCYKGSFGKTTDWSEWSQEMEDYMQDVVVTTKLWHHSHRYLTGSQSTKSPKSHSTGTPWMVLDETAAWKLASALEKNFITLVKVFEGYTLTLQEQSSLLNDLIKHKATSLEPHLPD